MKSMVNNIMILKLKKLRGNIMMDTNTINIKNKAYMNIHIEI